MSDRMNMVLTWVVITVCLVAPVVVTQYSVDDPVVEVVADGPDIGVMKDSVVQIWGITKFFSGFSASGVIITDDGCIATAKHCLEGNLFMFVKINGNDIPIFRWVASADSEFAVAKLDLCDLTPAPVARDYVPAPASRVYAIGWAGGVIDDYMTMGFVSQTEFDVQGMGDCILFNLTLEQGMSGGGMFNEDGELFGVNVGYFGNNKMISVGAPITQLDEFVIKLRGTD